MWDVIVLTAGNEEQKEIFHRQLDDIPWRIYTRSIQVSVDPPGIRVGSGGATIHLLRSNPKFAFQHVLLIHSGGLSQRTPHLSIVGKLFAMLPNGKTLLELKLSLYRPLPFVLPSGIFFSASDVIESLPHNFPQLPSNVDVLLLAHESPLSVAEQHGVYIVDPDGKLQRVLQKPRREEMEENGAIREGELTLTDSAFWMSSMTIVRLSSIDLPINCEFCVYGDFLRPLGERKDLSYISSTQDVKLKEWREMLSQTLKSSKAQIVNCGPSSFFHFGSLRECLQHFEKESQFFRVVISQAWNIYVYSKGNFKAPCTSFMEYCSFTEAQIGEHSLLSGCCCENPVIIPNEVFMMTLPVRRQQRLFFVTILIGMDDDVKKTMNDVVWGGSLTARQGCLWSLPLFPLLTTRSDSFEETLRLYKERSYGIVENCHLFSMEEAMRNVDREEMFKWRLDMYHSVKEE